MFKAPLGLYCLSKADSVKGNKGLSKFFKKIGEPPVVYDSEGTLYGMRNIEQALYSDGYCMHKWIHWYRRPSTRLK